MTLEDALDHADVWQRAGDVLKAITANPETSMANFVAIGANATLALAVAAQYRALAGRIRR